MKAVLIILMMVVLLAMVISIPTGAGAQSVSPIATPISPLPTPFDSPIGTPTAIQLSAFSAH